MALLILLATVYTSCLGHKYRDYVFQKNLPRYQELAELVKTQPTPLHWTEKEIHEKYRGLTFRVLAQKESQGQWAISFAWGGGFPIKHSAFLYISDNDIDHCSDKLKSFWPHRRKIIDHWYAVGD